MSFGNPYAANDQRHDFWEMCVRRDLEAFLAGDWSICAADYHAPGFIGLSAAGSDNPDDWSIAFPTLESYREAWLQQSRDFRARVEPHPARAGLYRAVSLAAVRSVGASTLVHKKFAGSLARRDGTPEVLSWQSLFIVRRFDAGWKLCGFVGYLPNPMGAGGEERSASHAK